MVPTTAHPEGLHPTCGAVTPPYAHFTGKQPEMCEKVRALYQAKQKEIRMPSSPNVPKDDKDSNTGSTWDAQPSLCLLKVPLGSSPFLVPYHTPEPTAGNPFRQKELCVLASLVAQWLRLRLPTQATWVRALVREDPTCRGATKPVRNNY
ncbi:hypothetical protein J1605_007546 [Eschrichtius robustus]|uniref:Uncharacterized protein n=1 Tax=Eschrichtius robustus TaxID=9764 RepID=A0AB34H272_ESCRO|nr:hypothetical protein J1605_007546 [Eschrichtius robustus]